MSNRRLFWRIVESIEASIDSGHYAIGCRLPPERALAEIYNVSRPTIREAIIALEVRGRIEVKTGSGVYVLEDATRTSSTKILNAFEVTHARALIEGEVAAIAATTINKEELKQLHATIITMKNENNIETADEEFHKVLAKSTRNGAMILSVQNLWKLRSLTPEIINDYNRVCIRDNKQTLTEHKAIYTALKSGNASKARQAMHNHFNRLINSQFEAVESKTLEEVKRKNNEKRELYSIPALKLTNSSILL
ncbi:FadR/GntR family transcriptional regulator [Colwellia echini]|uniref:FadR family transcriptional regulator n=1 Tax=Colwellia echini TaxID=1982103 RepID=A0ABY3MZ56_9GAMM|nr:FadR/GntR family transcriptional regulator [Colwellia echini]TYK66277.1 FadR family transcriptional regulator [Colwellia echini]